MPVSNNGNSHKQNMKRQAKTEGLGDNNWKEAVRNPKGGVTVRNKDGSQEDYPSFGSWSRGDMPKERRPKR